MTILVVTGTSTDVGKTIATAALAAAAMKMGATVAVAKPAQTGVADGEPGDLAEIQRRSGVVDLRESARYPDPLAPDVAARRASMPLLTLETVLDDIRSLTADLVLVEGAGGLLVRLGEDGFTLADVARELDAPVVARHAQPCCVDHPRLGLGRARVCRTDHRILACRARSRGTNQPRSAECGHGCAVDWAAARGGGHYDACRVHCCRPQLARSASHERYSLCVVSRCELGR